MIPKATPSVAFPLVFLLISFFSCTWLSAQTPVQLGGDPNSSVEVLTSHDQNGHGRETINGLGRLPNLSAASRFLGQATLGADYETILRTSEMSYADWLDSQFVAPRAFSIEQFTVDLTTLAADSTFAMGNDPNDVRPRLYYWHSAWWQYVMTSPDLLRSRVALALSEIFVISELPELEDVPLALANYYDMLLENTFGNFRELLGDVTFHPAMGIYLTHVNNPRSDTLFNRFPDENYAREVMQLFTIGLYELNPDGSQQLDSLGQPIPTYDSEDIAELAKIFTGLTFGDALFFGQNPQSEQSFTIPMKMIDNWHEPGPKVFLKKDTIPDRQPVNGLADVNEALDLLFHHPNVGPFISRLLIQRLVRSNPSPAYIARVAAAFADNGSGVRGDMKAVIRAILLDPEARDCALVNDPFEGMLREPMLRYTQLCRAFNAFTPSGLYRNDMDEFYELLFQRPLASPSVFNFFLPDYQPIGPIDDADLVAPEFQITNSVSIIGYANRLHDWIMKDNQVMEYRSFFSGEQSTNDKRVNLDLADELALEDISELDALIERLNLILVHGQLTEASRSIIREAISQIPDSQWEIRVRMTIFLIMISPDYLIFR